MALEAPVTSIPAGQPAPAVVPAQPNRNARPSAFLNTVAERAESGGDTQWGNNSRNAPPDRTDVQDPRQQFIDQLQPHQRPDANRERGELRDNNISDNIDEATPERAIEPEPEQQYDDEGNPIDMEALRQQRFEALQAIGQALEEGKFPLEQLQDFPVEVKINGESREVPLREAIAGYQRAQHATRVLERGQAMFQQAQHVLGLERARTQQWQDPNALRQGLVNMGLGPAVNEVAMQIAKERIAYLELSPAQRQEHDVRQMLARERADIARQRAEIQAQQQPQGPDPHTIHVQKQIEQLMPRALRQVGFQKHYPMLQAQFVRELQILCVQDGQVTPDRAMEAAQSVRDYYEDVARMQGQGGIPQPGSGTPEQQAYDRARYPLGPKRLASGPVQGPRGVVMGNIMGNGQGTGPAKGGRRPSDFLRVTGLG